MTHITEARVIANHAAMCRTPAATDRPYLTVGEVFRAGIWRAAARKEMAAAQSTWDSEGGATDQPCPAPDHSSLCHRHTA